MRRLLTLLLSGSVLVACGGSSPASVAPTQPAAAATPTAAATAAAILTGPPPTAIPGCLPKCWFGHISEPGPISGPYTTKYFFGGQMSLTVPAGWYGYEDSTGELAIGRPNDDNARLEFWIDIEAAADPNGTPDASVDRTGDAVLAWFLKKKIIHVLDQATTTVGGLPAKTLEYSRNDKAATEDPGCPAALQPCSVAFTYPEWHGGYFGEGRHFHSKLLVVNATWGGERHTIYVSFAAIDPDYDDLIETVDAVIGSVTWPTVVEAAT
jgi:hypothetical protein